VISEDLDSMTRIHPFASLSSKYLSA
jgi:hypothetical protein